MVAGIHLWKFSSAGRASALQAEGHRFEPCNFHFFQPFCKGKDLTRVMQIEILHRFGSLAQSVEHWTFNPGVPGSSPG